MSQSPSEKKSKLFPIIVVVALFVLGLGLFFAMVNERENDVQDIGEAITESTFEGVAEEIKEEAEENASNALPDNEVDIATITNTGDAVSFDMSAALQERVLGNPDAPVKISEHSSFSCGHCAKFHNTTFDAFKTNWIDTGKAYLVFSDFPLNAPALHASLVGRCITNDDQYFAYVKDVFANQSDWAFQSDHLAPLKEIASKYGVDGDMFKSCIQNEELQAGLLDKVRAAQQQFGVNSTPSFVVNNAVTISGGTDYPEFNKIIEGAIEESNAPAADDAE